MEARPTPETDQVFGQVHNGNYVLYEGLHEIAKVLGKAPVTAWRYIHKHDLPAAKFPGGTWVVSNTLIDAWLVARHKAIMEQKRERAGTG